MDRESRQKRIRLLLDELRSCRREVETRESEIRVARGESERVRRAHADFCERAPVALITLDRQGVIQEANPKFAVMLGMDRSKLLGRSLCDFVAPHDAEIFRRHIRNVYENGSGASCELGFVRHGRSFYAQMDSIVERDEQGGDVQFRTILVDITRHVQNKQRLRTSEARRQAILDAATDAIMAITDHGTIIAFNPAAEAMFGYSASEMIGQHLRELMPEIFTSSQTTFENSMITSESSTLRNVRETVGWRKDGSTFPVELSVSKMRVGDQRGYVGIVRDNTDRKWAEESLRESEARFRQVVENVTEVIWLMELPNLNTLYVSPAYETVWCRLRRSVYDDPKSWMDALHQSDRDRVVEFLHSAAPQGECEEEYRVVRPDGQVRFVHDRCFPVRDDQGNVYRIARITNDVTEQKRSAEAQQRTEKLRTLGLLAAGIAHDFSNLIGPISRFLESIRATSPQDEALRSHLDVAERAARQALGMTQSLQSVAYRSPSEKRIISLGDTCRDAAGLVRHLISVRIVQVWNISDQRLYVRADPTQIQQVLLNLVTNARDAMPEGGTVRISLSKWRATEDEPLPPPRSLRHDGDYARIDVSDTGGGIPHDVRAHIFEPFFTTRSDEPRSGLGLAIVDRIVEDCEGWIEVENNDAGGSTFSIFLPCVVDEEQLDTALHVPTPTSLGMLVVAPDEFARSIMATSLRDAGHAVQQAEDGAEALRIIQAKRDAIHVAVINAELPDLDGVACFERIQNVAPDVYGLIIAQDAGSGVFDTVHQERCAVLFKPFPMDRLHHALAQLLRGRRYDAR